MKPVKSEIMDRSSRDSRGYLGRVIIEIISKMERIPDTFC